MFIFVNQYLQADLSSCTIDINLSIMSHGSMIQGYQSNTELMEKAYSQAIGRMLREGKLPDY